MKYKLPYLVLLILVFSCKNTVKKSASCFLEPRPNIKALLDSFVKVTGKAYPEYGLYIDKGSPHQYDLIVYAGNYPLTRQEDQLNNQSPIQKVQVSGIEFKVYSGIEHYFQNGCNNDTVVLKEYANGGDNVIWAVKDSFGVMNTYKVEGAYPFIALPGKIPDSIKLKLPADDSSSN
ncbi:hypothetical protein [Filimonas effusa]|uniref:Uncharacterized protein n=1 Tax=Filimonas effusa TaxID=2508721 RepID=A0A4Q1DB22_9BACT|nr:hypothetical protein [Filimonas effusa]RXK86632.1 hypothetical protein ESB13_07460 [Filimonas effusa]